MTSNLEELVRDGVAKAAVAQPVISQLRAIKCKKDDYLEET